MVKRNTQTLLTPKGWGTTTQPWPPMHLLDWIEWADAQPDPMWLIPGILPADAAVLMSGRAKLAKKTWLAFEIAIGLASGRSIVPALQPVQAVPVFVIELEGPTKQTSQRWKCLLAPYMGKPLGQLYYWHRADFLLDDEAHMQAMCQFVRDAGIKFLIIDTLAMANRADENSVRDVGEVMRRIKDLRGAMHGGTVMYLHHLRKPPESKGSSPDIDTEIRGTSALAGFYDAHFALREAPGRDKEHLELTVRQSDAIERYFQLSWHIDVEHSQKAILDMRELNPEAVTQEDAIDKLAYLMVDQAYSIAELQDAWGVNQDMALAIRNSLLDTKMLVKKGKGRVVRVP